MSRTLIVANRLPVTVRLRDGAPQLIPSPGGLATALRRLHADASSLWLGWAGEDADLTPEQREQLAAALARDRLVNVPLTTDQVDAYYAGFSNSVLWPLFHYQIDRVPLESREWSVYKEVNLRFAEAVAEAYQTGDRIWVHDYQLMLVPGMLRRLVPHARIGFFLHIPFPSYEIFRTLPWRRELLEGMLGADLVGFHTFPYARYFSRAVQHIIGLEPKVDRLFVGSREVRIGAFPLGVDAEQFAELANDPRVQAQVAEIKKGAAGRRIILGLDRLDYTKGIPRRLLAFERLLEREPKLAKELRLIQVAVPSRVGVEHYRRFRRQLDEMVGRINGRFGSTESLPIHYLYRSVPMRQLVALYMAADVMLVTALRDGMNLVAKEFVASRADEDGVLMLSEFAGAADELGEALLINPYDVDAVADGIRQALEMSREERRARMRSLRQRVTARTSHRWSDAFLRVLDRQPSPPLPPGPRAETPSTTLGKRLSAIESPVLLLDYDGTLVPLRSLPELASPDAALLELIQDLAAALTVNVVSGRPRPDLERWLGDLPIALWAEHGAWHRPARDAEWVSTVGAPPAWLRGVRALFEEFAACTPGALVEEKSVSIAWHYRAAESEAGERQARELRMLLLDTLQGEQADVLHGSKVIEVRPRGVHKGRVVEQILRGISDPSRLVAMGDDRTDEDMFAAVPAEGVTIHVGSGPSRASYRLENTDAVRTLLRLLAAYSTTT